MSSIKALDSLSGNLSSKQEITGDLSVTKEYDAYSGPYEITPKAFESQMLETKNRVLRANLEITEVPYWETSNEAGGNTVYIADEIKKDIGE